MKRRKNLGFTLVELLAVLVALGLFAVIIIPKYFHLQEASRKKSALNLIYVAKTALIFNFSKNLLQTGNPTEAWDVLDETICDNDIAKSGYEGYLLICNKNGDTINISVEYGGVQIATGTFTNPNKED